MGIVNRVVSPSLLEISLKQSRRLLYKINAKNSSHCKLGLMMYACWNTLENSATVYLNDSATNVCGFFFFVLHLWPSLLRVLRHVLMQISNRLIGIFKISDLLKILGFNKKTSRETREKKIFFLFLSVSLWTTRS